MQRGISSHGSCFEFFLRQPSLASVLPCNGRLLSQLPKQPRQHGGNPLDLPDLGLRQSSPSQYA